MDKRELIQKIKERYGILQIDIDGEVIELKPTVEFYEGFLVRIALDDKKELAEYLYRELANLLKKQLGMNDEEARWFMVEYGDDVVAKLIEKFEKKKKRQET